MVAASRVKHYREVCMPTPRSPIITLMLVLLLLVAGLTPCLCTAKAQQPPSPAPAPNNMTRGPIDPAELASFLNTTITDQLTNDHIAGATVAVVKDGKLFYTKGYGYAGMENKTPVDANVSMFAIGSVTKLFTWTAVMQLVEQGKIDLHADVNTYLKDFKIPATYPQPITVENLMTHTAGFEEQPVGLAVSDSKDLQPPDTVLAQTIPARVWPPGQVWSYSNWGAALAGYIVEEVSGMPFNQYVKEKLFSPLGMNNTTIEQPAPPQLAPNVAKAYAYNNGVFEQKHDMVVQLLSAGAIRTTAPDMAKFMIAHLNNGTYNDTRILNTSTAQDMHRAHFTPDPYTKFGLGFLIGTQNNESSISHTGGTYYFYTQCILWPERNVGLFVSYNSPPGGLAGIDLVQKFLDHYYPYTPTPPQPANSNDAPSLSGTYQNTRSVYTTVFKYLIALSMPQTVDVVGYPNGTLIRRGSPLNLVEVAPLVFARPDGNTTIAGISHFIFTIGSNGTYYHGDAIPQYYERLPWYATPAGVTNLGYLCLAVFASVALWPLSTLHARWRHGITPTQTPAPTRTRLPSLAHWVMGIAAILYWLVFLLPYIVALVLGDEGMRALLTSLTSPPPIIAWLTLPIIAIALTLGGILLTALIWTRRYWNTFGRIHYMIVTGAALAFIAWLNYWNLIGFKW